MRLPSEFIRLPLIFDAARLAEEVARFDESDWRPHPEGHPGNWALPLVSVGGDPENDGVKGAMRPTPHLARCPYIREVLASLGSPIGRTRLMRIDGNAEATPHVDLNYYWMQRVRVHVPVITDPAVRFICGEREIHMAAGEAWVFDTWKVHNVVNPKETRRIHLVIDTKMAPHPGPLPARGERGLEFETHNYPVVMSPEEQASLVPLLDGALSREVERFLDAWREIWHVHGERRSGWPKYRALLARFDEELGKCGDARAANIARHMLVHPALNPELAEPERVHVAMRRLDRPVFIVSSPRSGSSLLFETLAKAPGVFAPPGESHRIIEGIEELHPAAKGWESNRLTANDAAPEIVTRLERRFLDALRDRNGDTRLPERVRMLEKTPKNSLRIPFLKAAFPDALFIYLYRDPRATISSMLDAWRSGRFVTYEELKWSLLLVPGWRDVVERPLNEIVAHQWETATRILLDDLEALPADSWCVASYDALVGDPQKEITRLCEFVGFRWDTKLTAPLPLSRHTLTPPGIEKLTKNGPEIDAVFERVRETAERAREVFARPPLQRVRVAPEPPEEPKQELSFRSVHTSTFPELLAQLGASLLVSTYQSGRVVAVRADGDQLNTHLVAMRSPMGIAAGAKSLAIGTAQQVWTFRREHSDAKHDAYFAPRAAHVTGDIRVHEI
ncbi:MAG TPA: sulfotransferase, partial [Thermoanaerobaculia bacterium]|nr:sulfotransferase [Thermoanaerobaculia bacterium]